MGKKITILFLFLVCLITGFSNPVNRQTAQTVATNFWNVVTGQNGPSRWTDITEETPFQEFYLFTQQDGKGFVIVAADDCVQPILGYSTDSRFVTPLPPSVEWFLNGFEHEIAYCKENNIAATSEITLQWVQLMEGEYSPQSTTAVTPMLTTTWDQEPYYNNLCPDSSGYHAYAGCVAIATSQVMKYWNWPISGIGSYSYYDDNLGYQYANFGNTTYNWSLMPNSLSSSSSTAQINAVATLVYHVGVAVEMDYGLDGSGAYSNSYGYSSLPCSENALKDYFRYKNTIHSVYRDDVTNSVWISTLNSELNAGRPIIERGGGDDGGHAFVCDGYDNNGLYHINWGWGGSSNGYFAHNNLNPGSYTFNDGNALVVGIEPDGQMTLSPSTLNFTQSGGSLAFTVTSSSSSSSSWTASSNQSWLTLSPNTGAGSGATTTVTATATPNNTGSTRTAVVTISQGTTQVTMQVTQMECSNSDMCTITLSMEDSYGDGWNGASLTLSSASGYVYGIASFDNGSSATQQFSICPSNLVLTWNTGSWDSECSFTLTNSNGVTLMTATSPNFTTHTVTSPCSSGSNPPSSCTITSFPWVESFEDGISCWTIIDADGDGYTWDASFLYGTEGAAHSGDGMIASASYINSVGALTPDNWLITPAINLTSTANLTFWVKAQDASYSAENYSVYVATSNTVAAFTATTAVLTGTTTSTWEQKTVNLSSYVGQTIYIAFRHHNTTDMYWLDLDDVSISTTTSTNYSVSVISANSVMGSATGGGTYPAGTEIELTATANSGYRFTGWNDGNTENPRYVNVTSNATYIAYFDNLGGSEHHYDNGEYASTIGAGGTLYWGIRFPAGELSGYSTLSSVKIWDIYAGTYQMSIYQGGSNAPGTQVYTQTYNLSGSEDWYTATLNSPVTINHSQPLWIVFYNNGVNYPAAGSNYAGNPDGSWVSTDNSDWASVCDYNFYYTWMIRAVLSNTSPAQQYTITTVSANSAMGSASGGGVYQAGDTIMLMATANSAYRFTGWSDGYTENPRYVVVTGNATYTAQFADLGDSEHHYDNGEYAGSIGAGGTLYWGIRFAAGELSGYTTLSSVKIWDAYAGTYQMSIYQGGSTAPSSLVYSQSYYLSGSEDWYTATLNTPMTIDHTQPLWIVFNNNGVSYPAAGSHYAGNPDGSWVSTDNSDWTSVCNHDLYYTWMIRAVLSNSSPAQQYTITVVSANPNMGTVSGGGTYPAGTDIELTATANSSYRFTGWNDGNTENPRYVNVTGNASYTANFADLGDSEHHYDNGEYASSIGAGGTLYWGIRFAAGELSGYTTLSAVKIWDAYAGTYQMSIYQGGSTSPGTLVYTQTYNLSGSEDWHTATLNSPVTINHSQPLWIVFYNNGVNYPAAGSHYAGNPDGSWVSTDNSDWTSVCDYAFYYTWMIRAVLSNSSPAQQYTITVVSANPNMGTVSGGGTFDQGTTTEIAAIPYENYEFVRWYDGNTDNPRIITVTENATYIAEFQATIGISEIVANKVEIYSYGRQIFVNNAEGLPVEIYDMAGKLIVSEQNNLQDCRVFTMNTSGLYLVRTGNGVIKKVSIIR